MSCMAELRGKLDRVKWNERHVKSQIREISTVSNKDFKSENASLCEAEYRVPTKKFRSTFGPSMSAADIPEISELPNTKNICNNDVASGPVDPESNCAICHSNLEDKSVTSTCPHTFCFDCSAKRYKLKAECPLCKQSFQSMIPNIQSYDDYEQNHIESQENEASCDTTIRNSSVAIHQDIFSCQSFGDIERCPTALPRRLTESQVSTQQNWRRHQSDSRELKSSIDKNGTKIKEVAEADYKQRDITPAFFSANLAATYRLIPWLERELNALVTNHVQLLVLRITDVIKQHDILSQEFYQYIYPFFGKDTRQFMERFYKFARCPFSKTIYDTIYEQEAQSLSESETSTASSEDDSDALAENVKAESPRMVSLQDAEHTGSITQDESHTSQSECNIDQMTDSAPNRSFNGARIDRVCPEQCPLLISSNKSPEKHNNPHKRENALKTREKDKPDTKRFRCESYSSDENVSSTFSTKQTQPHYNRGINERHASWPHSSSPYYSHKQSDCCSGRTESETEENCQTNKQKKFKSENGTNRLEKTSDTQTDRNKQSNDDESVSYQSALAVSDFGKHGHDKKVTCSNYYATRGNDDPTKVAILSHPSVVAENRSVPGTSSSGSFSCLSKLHAPMHRTVVDGISSTLPARNNGDPLPGGTKDIPYITESDSDSEIRVDEYSDSDMEISAIEISTRHSRNSAFGFGSESGEPHRATFCEENNDDSEESSKDSWSTSTKDPNTRGSSNIENLLCMHFCGLTLA
ncbi:E3 ubiquitin-protein ligase Topors-like [Gigantopelta aegis]|uniref:E3 ubiquitin-protein ligase Topors-like n=1 Tax=Gigantopelta aegis TaxID=1735272 RepID=UPI001B88C5A5|nr:E3 ubiquitin-protein ligase Topors-like [Gigantopelta aegis]XP_041363002.1 E3 ubiquitin-protein ligase Topors-like [Gigantopelta aegis]XP_041363003.1 E3 ubiquitin-protein ligase Topors-like [Gigantopelta aegis]